MVTRMLLIITVVIGFCIPIFAGEKLEVKGNFTKLGSVAGKDGIPVGWVPNAPGSWDDSIVPSLAVIPDLDKKMLRMTSQAKKMQLYYGKKWAIAPEDKCFVKAIVKGKGGVDLGVYFYPGGGALLKGFQATEVWTEYTSEITIPKISGYAADPVIKEIFVVFGITPGSSIEFADVTAEIIKKGERCIVAPGASLTGAEPVCSVYALAQSPEMDGKWDESVWKNIPVTAGFRNYKNGSAVTERQTGFKTGAYGENLYIAVKCKEPEPDKIKVDPDNYSKGWYPDDNLEFFFTHDRTPRVFKQFVVNSSAARWCNVPNADGAWQAAAYRGDDFWSVEIKIPFSLLSISGDVTSELFMFNLARAAYRNPENEQLSSFASVKDGFGDVDKFALLTSFKETAPDDLAEMQKYLNPLRNWMSYRLWKIANVKEGILVDRQVDDNIRDIAALKQQAKTILESKITNGALQLIMQYEKRISETGTLVKLLSVAVKDRDAKTKIFGNGKEIAADASGKCSVGLKEGVNVIGLKVVARGGNPGVRLSIAGQMELESRWRVGTADNDGWLTSSFDDRTWKKAETDKDGYLRVPDGITGDVCFRQIVLWSENHYSSLSCIQPKVREWCFSEKSMENLIHNLYSPPPLTFALEDYEFILDVPKGFRLLEDRSTNETKSGRVTRRPQKVAAEEVKRDGQPYTRYRLSYNPEFVQPDDTNSKVTWQSGEIIAINKQGQASLIPLVLNEYTGADKQCKFYFRRSASGNLTEIEQTLPVRVLPPINGRVPKKVVIQQYILPWLLGGLGGSSFFPEQLDFYMRQTLDNGFNSWIIPPSGDAYVKDIYSRVIEQGGEIVLWSPNNYPLHGGIRTNFALGQLMEGTPESRGPFFNEAESLVRLISKLFVKPSRNSSASSIMSISLLGFLPKDNSARYLAELKTITSDSI